MLINLGHGPLRHRLVPLLRMQERRHLRVPQGEQPPEPFLPDGFRQPEPKRGIGRADKRSGSDVEWIVDPQINAREGDEHRHRQHEPDRAPVIPPRHRREHEPIRGVTARHAAGAPHPHEDPGLGQRYEGPGPAEKGLEAADDPDITDHPNEAGQDREDPPAPAALPDQQQPEKNEGGNEIAVAADEGHQPVEERIDQVMVPPKEHPGIQCLEPFHEICAVDSRDDRPKSLLKKSDGSVCERGGRKDEAQRLSISAAICEGGATKSVRPPRRKMNGRSLSTGS